MYCTRCGSEVPAESRFCPVCGRPVEAGGASIVPAAYPPGPTVQAVPAPAFAYAGFWLRFAAMIIDSIVFLPLTLVLIIPIAVASPRLSEEDPAHVGAFVGMYIFFTLIAVAGTWLYYTLMESSRYQATLGKKLLGLAVTDLDGNRISFGRANGRFFAKYLSSLILNIGFVMAAFTDKRQALHDLLTGCLVIRR